jgi:Phage terminase large subunit (GpA)
VSVITDSFRAHWLKPPFRGEIYDYAAKINLQDGYAKRGLFDVHLSRYLIDVFKSLRDPRVRTEVTLKAVQTGGTLVAELRVPYLLEHEPFGGILFLSMDDGFIKDFADTRFMPMLKSIPDVARMIEGLSRHKNNKLKILFPGNALLMGGLNEGNVQSLSWRNVIIDECWRAKSNGLIGQAEARTSAFQNTSKFHLISQAGVEGDDLDVQWKLTNMKEWCWRCPGCSRLQPYYWVERRDDNSWCGMLWDDNEKTRPGGRWNMSEVLLTVRMVCKYCPQVMTDTPHNRRRLDASGEYLPQNPGALPGISGHHWNSMANVDISFASLVYKYLDAKRQSDDFGLTLPLMEFYQKRLAKPWALNQDSAAIVLRSENYDPSLAWVDEAFRFMTVDCQKDFTKLYVIIRAWSLTGESRQLCRRIVGSFEEAAAVQKEFTVADQRVFVDIGYEQTKVARECSKRGHWGLVGAKTRWLCWNGLKGSDFETFTHKVHKLDSRGRKMRDINGKPILRDEQRIYSKVEYLNPNIGTNQKGQPCPYYVHSNLNFKDILKRLRDGKGAKWECLPDPDPISEMDSFTNQIHSEICIREKDKYGKKKKRWVPVSLRRANHWWDCEEGQVVAAAIAKIIGDTPAPPEAEEVSEVKKEEVLVLST